MKTIFTALVVLLSVFSYAQSKKSSNQDLVNKVENIKAFKKLLRTKTNVLVMFAKNGDEASKSMGVFGDAAAKAKGIGTLAWVDCSDKDGKKLCKNQKMKPDSVEIVHFKDGENAGKYERKFSVKSIHAFLKNPTSDGPWEEEDTAKDVVHLSSEAHIKKIVKKNKPTLIMFYAPWCGHCKRFKPAFAEVATDMKKKWILAGYDAEGASDAAAVRAAFNVTGFPRTLYFADGEFQFEYSAGHSVQQLTEWIDDPQPPKEKEPEVAWSDGENDVYHLDEDTFDAFIEENEKVLVMFYAPWCGHCKRLKPDWETAATQIKDEEMTEKLAALDAQAFPKIAKRFGVTGYPTLTYFENGEVKFDAGRAMKRTAEGIIEYIKNPTEPPPPEKAWSETESEVVHLGDSDFSKTLKKIKHSLIMFYAPWCGHCKAAKPEFQNAAEKFADDKKVAFAAVNCDEHKETCNEFGVKGFPTFFYQSYGKNELKYERGRTEDAFTSYMSEQRGIKMEL